MYFADAWIGFLCDNVVRDCVTLAEKKCAGCLAKLASPLLHEHIQNSLLEKMLKYYDEVRGAMLTRLPKLYDQIKEKIVHSNDSEKDQVNYINAGHQFLLFSTPNSIYHGRFIGPEMDNYIKDSFKPPTKSRIKREKRGGRPCQGAELEDDTAEALLDQLMSDVIETTQEKLAPKKKIKR